MWHRCDIVRRSEMLITLWSQRDYLSTYEEGGYYNFEFMDSLFLQMYETRVTTQNRNQVVVSVIFRWVLSRDVIHIYLLLKSAVHCLPGHKRIYQQEAVSVIYNGNWTEWNVIWSGIVWVMSKSHEFDLKSQVWFQTKIARHKVQAPLYCIHPKFNRSDAGFFLLVCTNILLI